MHEIFEKLCEKHGITAYRFCKDTGVNASTISTWKKNNSLAGPELSKKVCDYFNISLDYLMTGKEDTAPKEPILKPKDRKDIDKILMETEELLKQEGLMFDGTPASQEAIESILSAMQIGLEMAKKKNKEKYTPNKYKKDK